MLSRDHLSNYLKQHDEKTLVLQTALLSTTIFIKKDLVNNGYSLFAEEVILKPQYAEEFTKSF